MGINCNIYNLILTMLSTIVTVYRIIIYSIYICIISLYVFKCMNSRRAVFIINIRYKCKKEKLYMKSNVSV